MQNTTINLTDTQQIISAVKGRLGIGKYQVEKRRRDQWHRQAGGPARGIRAGWVWKWRRVGAGEKHDGRSCTHAAREAAAARRASDIVAATTGTAARAAGPAELSRACWTDLAVTGLDRALIYTRAHVARRQ